MRKQKRSEKETRFIYQETIALFEIPRKILLFLKRAVVLRHLHQEKWFEEKNIIESNIKRYTYTTEPSLNT